MTEPQQPKPLPVRQIDRTLSFIAIGLLILSVLCFFSIMIASWVGFTAFDQAPWPAVSTITLFAPPISFVLILVVLISNIIRRSKANREN